MNPMSQVSELLEGVRRNNITERKSIGDALSTVQVGQTIKVHTDSRQKPWIGKVTKASEKHGSWTLKGLRGGGAAIDRNIHRDDLFFLTIGGGRRLQHASEMVTKIEESVSERSTKKASIDAVVTFKHQGKTVTARVKSTQWSPKGMTYHWVTDQGKKITTQGMPKDAKVVADVKGRVEMREAVGEGTINQIKELLTRLGFGNVFISRSGGNWIDITFDPPKKYGSTDLGFNVRNGKQTMYRELKKAGLLKKFRDGPGALFGVLVP